MREFIVQVADNDERSDEEIEEDICAALDARDMNYTDVTVK